MGDRLTVGLRIHSLQAYRTCFSTTCVTASPCKKSLVRHPSLVTTKTSDLRVEDCETKFIPILRSGAWADVGFRSSMEDVYVCADNFVSDFGVKSFNEEPNAFYGVFDGHGGKHAADFACYHLPRFIAEDKTSQGRLRRPLLQPLVVGSSLVVANAGDCRAVLCRRGKAIEMSRDHKAVCSRERNRIEASGGYICDGYLNGQLNVARALGDWHMEGLKDRAGGPLTAEPELMSTRLTEEDEFLIIGCDGIWDVFMSQNAVDFARRRLQEHNDPFMCSKDVIDEALKRKSGDNLAVVVVCFQPQPPPNLVVPRSRVHRSISADGLKELQSFLDSLGY
ncbi:hypothetical protein F0562_007225 [Nyssa sinensis]|uniref:protein-serine/threonine phosphatase n=1 Tax=Nyssa sinensis TaxID=561372 RepID=A0A5J5A7L7_9ASTE|nr:hypothetical protein F0562_007225 [Nyssa sinensis]